jgi:hypothetical protein
MRESLLFDAQPGVSERPGRHCRFAQQQRRAAASTRRQSRGPGIVALLLSL